MTVTHGPEVAAAILDLCAIPAADRQACALMLGTPADSGTQRALESLDARWGDAAAPEPKHLDGVTSSGGSRPSCASPRWRPNGWSAPASPPR